MTRRQYRAVWLRLHKRYERRGLTIFRKGLRQAIQIPYSELNDFNYRINIIQGVQSLYPTYVNLYENTGVRHGKKVGREINKEIAQEKNFDPTAFEGSYRNFISNWLINNAGTRIISVREELIEYLIKFIADKLEEGADIRTISRQLEKHILSRGFYRWQIERIVRTETTAAANWGAIQAGESSRVLWEKVWISSNDARTRRRPESQFDHFDMDGITTDKGEPFNVNGDFIQYPGDPKGNPSNIINCRCTVAVRAKRDENGKIIFRRTLEGAISL